MYIYIQLYSVYCTLYIGIYIPIYIYMFIDVYIYIRRLLRGFAEQMRL